jgi:hypothetical protein
MRTKTLCLAAFLAATTARAVLGQDTTSQAPLSAIDWLDSLPQSAPIVLPNLEPDVATGANVPSVSVTPLEGPAAQIIGLVPSDVSGLPENLWQGSDAAKLAQALGDMPDLTLPAAQATLFTLILAVAQPPSGKANAFDLARVDALIRAGALDPALALIEQIGPSLNPKVAHRFIDATLLNETEDPACALMTATPFLAPDYTYRIFCAARQGDWNTATLLLGTARAIGAITAEQTTLLERFLDPDLFEDAPELTRPSTPNPLTFRMHEALGSSISTRSWPAIYANADLRDVKGWKTQIEAAERLSLNGAMPANRLLGIYSERQPAASGGVWDRVSAIQRFETALNSHSTEAVTKTLPTAWSHMLSAGLNVQFATLFGSRIQELKLDEALHTHAFNILQSGADYELAAQLYPEVAASFTFRVSVAAGEVEQTLARTSLENAISRGFGVDAADPSLIEMAKSGALGLALLNTLTQLEAGAHGDMGQLSRALGTLRALGLEDAARRAALQLLIVQDTQ